MPSRPARGINSTAPKNSPTNRQARASLMPNQTNSARPRRRPSRRRGRSSIRKLSIAESMRVRSVSFPLGLPRSFPIPCRRFANQPAEIGSEMGLVEVAEAERQLGQVERLAAGQAISGFVKAKTPDHPFRADAEVVAEQLLQA